METRRNGVPVEARSARWSRASSERHGAYWPATPAGFGVTNARRSLSDQVPTASAAPSPTNSHASSSSRSPLRFIWPAIPFSLLSAFSLRDTDPGRPLPLGSSDRAPTRGYAIVDRQRTSRTPFGPHLPRARSDSPTFPGCQRAATWAPRTLGGAAFVETPSGVAALGGGSAAGLLRRHARRVRRVLRDDGHVGRVERIARHRPRRPRRHHAGRGDRLQRPDAPGAATSPFVEPAAHRAFRRSVATTPATGIAGSSATT